MKKSFSQIVITIFMFSFFFIACGDPNDYTTDSASGQSSRMDSVKSKDIILGAFTSVSLGGAHSCGIDINGRLWCWGVNEYAQLGDGTTVNRKNAYLITSDTDWAQAAAGEYFSCARKSTGTLWCWGDNHGMEVGDGTTAGYRFSPVQVGTDTDWVLVTAGTEHACGLKSDHSLWCWGQNAYGEVGNGTLFSTEYGPVELVKSWKTVSAGGRHTCAIKTDGTLWCWGNNQSGELGIGTLAKKKAPAKVGTAANWSLVAAGFFHTCAKKKDGTLWCWGQNKYGQVGNGATGKTVTKPVKVGSASNWDTISAGGFHNCALKKTTGGLYCWGWNGDGQLGIGNTVDQHKPHMVVNAGTGYQAVSAGGGHTCGLWSDNNLWCWGANGYGQLGDGTTVDSLAPSSKVIQ